MRYHSSAIGGLWPCGPVVAGIAIKRSAVAERGDQPAPSGLVLRLTPGTSTNPS